MAWKRISLLVIGLLLLTNLVTVVKLSASRHRWVDLYVRDAGMAVGQIHEASLDLEPVTAPPQTEDRDRLQRAVLKLETAYYALYELELQQQLPMAPRSWSQSVNVIQGPLRSMLVTGDYSDLPAAKQRLRQLADLLPLDQIDKAAELRAAQHRLDEPFAQ